VTLRDLNLAESALGLGYFLCGSRGALVEKSLERLHSGGVPAGKVYRAKDVFNDPHLAARQVIAGVVLPLAQPRAMNK
jgi:crotonobetainyl-CoA:carnitine CoA-transferase CaiB-like acyl-CoA transferase